jgi:hypothetical protein
MPSPFQHSTAGLDIFLLCALEHARRLTNPDAGILHEIRSAVEARAERDLLRPDPDEIGLQAALNLPTELQPEHFACQTPQLRDFRAIRVVFVIFVCHGPFPSTRAQRGRY